MLIDWAFLDDPEGYEAGEPHPASEAKQKLETLLAQIHMPAAESPMLSTFWGEVGLLWAKDDRCVKVGCTTGGTMYLFAGHVRDSWQARDDEDPPHTLAHSPSVQAVAAALSWLG